MKLFMNTDQAAEAIGMSVRQFRRLYMGGRIEALNFKPNRGKAGKSGRFLFRTSDVLRLKRSRIKLD